MFHRTVSSSTGADSQLVALPSGRVSKSLMELLLLLQHFPAGGHPVYATVSLLTNALHRVRGSRVSPSLFSFVVTERPFLCDTYSSMSVGLLMYLFMNGLLPQCVFTVVVIQ